MMVCPQCHQGYRQNLHCPQCQVRLQYQSSVATDPRSAPTDGGEWQQRPWGKIVIGLVLAQGICYGLQNLLQAASHAGSTPREETGSGLGTLNHLIFLHLIQALSLLVGGAICGAGQRQGILYGGLAGLVNGVIFLTWQRSSAEVFPPLVLYTMPVLHMIVGALGGLAGRTLWQPVADFLPAETKPVVTLPTVSTWRLFEGRVHLGRAFAGIFIVVAGVVWSNAILEFVLAACQGTITVSSHLQAQLLGWEVIALATLIGSGFAGATTSNGFKNGMIVGIGASVVIAGVQMGSAKFSLDLVVMTVASVLLLALAGGWFGGQLFPPLAPGKRRRFSADF